ncbi:type II toxin-antitoxin system Phd/YefM family antitoxin [Silanimonas lenta]|uniref:type II toxin-antitoxin system Phd/YefM family antitoxin n=1 Tax=Silanimonas lenta TaxID=265429 RepID=UPI002FE0AC16
MKHSTQVKPISYLKNHAAEIASTLAETGEPLLITQNGEARLVVMDVAAWEQQEQALALLKILALGQRDIDAGAYRDATAVLDELGGPGE